MRTEVTLDSYNDPDVVVRSGPLRAWIEDEECLVLRVLVLDAWPYLYLDAPAEHYHLYRTLFFFGESAQDRCCGPIIDEINCMLDLFDILVGDGLKKMKSVWEEHFIGGRIEAQES